MIEYILVFLVAAVMAFVMTPLARKIAVKKGAIDVPSEARRVHTTPIPRMGGLAIVVPFTILALIFSGFNRSVIGIVLGGLVIAIGGVLDDIKSLKPLHKLMFQLLAVFILIIFDINIKMITIPFVSDNASMFIGIFEIPATILWVVGITNAINLIDGLDGLACGISTISAITILLVAMISGRYTAILLSAILAGACMGFLPYNFHPASIFLGDTGSQFLGFVLAAISIQGAVKSAAVIVVAVPILAIGVPIYDTLFAIVRRKLNHQPISEADRGHMHHRLLDMGIPHVQVVLLMYFVSILLGGVSVMAMKLSNKSSYILLIYVCAVFIATGIEFGLFTRRTCKPKKEDLAHGKD